MLCLAKHEFIIILLYVEKNILRQGARSREIEVKVNLRRENTSSE